MLTAIVAALLIGLIWTLHYSGLIGALKIPTNSMLPLFRSGDLIYIEAVTPHSRTIQRGDVRTFTTKDIKGIRSAESQIYIIRVVGLPGDELVIRDQKLWINNKPQSEVFQSPVEDYIDTGLQTQYSLVEPYKVPVDQFFVIGDNTRNSFDSRIWGPVPKENFQHLYWRHYYRSLEAEPKP
jgi:signal peptidase I